MLGKLTKLKFHNQMDLIKMDTESSIYAREINEIRTKCGAGARIVFVSGNFNIVHPGHLRLLNFARTCGDCLVVGVNKDGAGNSHIPEQLRLEGVSCIGIVTYAFILRTQPEEFIQLLKPDVVVKGKEYESIDNPEAPVIESYGGKLLFSSGEVKFSSLDLLQKEFRETNFSAIIKPSDFLDRHKFTCNDLIDVLDEFGKINAIVIGDLIIDEYINCDPLGMSREDPTIVVTPIRKDRFIGGAGIVAAHASGLGAKVSFFSVAGEDEISDYAKYSLKDYGVNCEIFNDNSRPTTLKQRFQAEGKTLLRVSHLRQQDVSQKIAQKLTEKICDSLPDANLVIFSDFNYGCLPQTIVDVVTREAQKRGIMIVADSQASSQVSDVSRFKNMHLLTPTEHEARLAVRDFSSGLVVLAEALKNKASSRQVVLTLGKEGLLIHAPEKGSDKCITDKLPAFNTSPRDVAGAGDSLLVSSALALVSGADIWRSIYLGSVAAACQVSRVGNRPLSADELKTELLL